MASSVRSSSYTLPAKYGGEVTTSATDASGSSGMVRASCTQIWSTSGATATSSSVLIVGAPKRS